jgi:hypothetical protein
VESDHPRFWWTVGRFGLCDGCGSDVTGKLIAYEWASRVAYCEGCTEHLGIADDCRESRRARDARREQLILRWARVDG